MAICGVFQQRNRVYAEAFFHVSLRIANAEMTHTNDEKLILPWAKDINCISSGKQTERGI